MMPSVPGAELYNVQYKYGHKETVIMAQEELLQSHKAITLRGIN